MSVLGPFIPLESASAKSSNSLTYNLSSSGFPSPADDYIEEGINLNKQLIQNPASTFFAKVKGNSMVSLGIRPEDLLIVDRSINPQPGCIVVAVLDGVFNLKRLSQDKGNLYLEAAAPSYQKVDLNNSDRTYIWGVAIYVIHALHSIKF